MCYVRYSFHPNRKDEFEPHYDLIISCRPLQSTENYESSSFTKCSCMKLNEIGGDSHKWTVKNEIHQTRNRTGSLHIEIKPRNISKIIGVTFQLNQTVYNAYILLATRKLRLICALCCRFFLVNFTCKNVDILGSSFVFD